MSISEIQKELALSDAALAKTITKIADYGHPVEASAFGVAIEHVKSLEKMIRENGNVIPAPSRISKLKKLTKHVIYFIYKIRLTPAVKMTN